MSHVINGTAFWRYSNPNVNLLLNKVSNLFSKENIVEEGNPSGGKIVIHSIVIKDPILGPEARLEISWQAVDPTQYHQGMKVKETIRMFSSIGVVANRKETQWHLSHEMTYWFGTREQIIRQRYFPTCVIHGIVYCELTHRLFEIHAVAMASSYTKYEASFLETMFSLQCHE